MFARHIYNSPAGFLDSDFPILLLSSFIIFYNNYIIYFYICQCGKSYARARCLFCEQSELDAAGVPWVPPSAVRPNKQAFVAHMEFREPEDAYEGQLSIEKNAIWGCVGLVGRYPVGQRPAIISHSFLLVNR